MDKKKDEKKRPLISMIYYHDEYDEYNNVTWQARFFCLEESLNKPLYESTNDYKLAMGAIVDVIKWQSDQKNAGKRYYVPHIIYTGRFKKGEFPSGMGEKND